MAWCLSWFELYLEVYRHRHVSSSFLMSGQLFPASMPSDAQAGGWLWSVLIASALAPLAFLIFSVREHLRPPRDSGAVRDIGDERFPLAAAAIAFGLVLAMAGAVNQVIRRPPLSVDLTLRTGNGGFIVLGGALMLTGWLIARRHARG